MLKSLEDISGTKKRITIEIPADALENAIMKGLQDARQKVRMPGFRQGKAPMTLIESRYGKNVEADVLEKIVPEYYMQAIQEAKVMPVSGPVIDGGFNFVRKQPLTATFTVDVMPKIENLQYEGIEVKDVPVEVKEEEVEALIKRLSEEKATFEAIDGPAEMGDLLTIDYKASGEGAEASDVVLKLGSGPYPKEFFEGIIGHSKNESFQVTAEFPAEPASPFAGKNVTFDITIKEAKRRSVVPVDDDFAKDLEFESLDALKERIRTNITSAKQRDAELQKQAEIVEKLHATHEVETPESLVNSEIEATLGEIRAQSMDERSDDEIRESLRPQAQRTVKTNIILHSIGEKEGTTVSEDELKIEIMTLAQRNYTSPENVMKYYIAKDGSLDGLKNAVFSRKVLSAVLAKAKTETPEA